MRHSTQNIIDYTRRPLWAVWWQCRGERELQGTTRAPKDLSPRQWCSDYRAAFPEPRVQPQEQTDDIECANHVPAPRPMPVLLTMIIVAHSVLEQGLGKLLVRLLTPHCIPYIVWWCRVVRMLGTKLISPTLYWDAVSISCGPIKNLGFQHQVLFRYNLPNFQHKCVRAREKW